MKKIISAVLAILLLISLCACNTDPAQPDDPLTPSDISPDVSPDNTDEPDDGPSGEEYPWRAVYTGFLSEKYEELSSLCYGGIAGIGFVDLDIDGIPELIVFDSGASASMGVQFFDISGDFVVCVSANSLDLRDAYGTSDFSDITVNANYFDDFRLIETDDGELMFYVESWNGALDFSYSEVVRFEPGKDHMTLTSVLYKYEEHDIDTGEDTEIVYQAGGEDISQQEYTDTYSYIFNMERTDWESSGRFLWDSRDYDDGLTGFMAMVNDAADLYTPVQLSDSETE